MNKFIVNLTGDLTKEIESEMMDRHILITWEDSILPDTIFVATNLNKDELELLDFVKEVKVPRVNGKVWI